MTSIFILLFSSLFFLLEFGLSESGKLLFSCDFGTVTSGTYCGMIRDVGDNFDWKLTTSSGKPDTGPQHDHTGNPGGLGRFLWTDSNDGSAGQMASISTPSFNLTYDQGWLTFWYHLYGVTFVSVLSSARSDVGVDDIYMCDLLSTKTIEPSTISSTSKVVSSFISPSLSNDASTVVRSSYFMSSDKTTESLQPLVKTGESYREMAIGFGIVALLLLLFGVAITVLYIRLRITLSNLKSEQMEKPYMDLIATGSQPSYEAVVSGNMSKDVDGSYENQAVVKQHQHIHPQSSTGDEYDYALNTV